MNSNGTISTATFRQVSAEDIKKYKDGDSVQREEDVIFKIGETAIMAANESHAGFKRKHIGDELKTATEDCLNKFNNTDTAKQVKDRIQSIIEPLLNDNNSSLYKLIAHDELPGEEFEDRHEVLQAKAKQVGKILKAKENVPNLLLHGLNQNLFDKRKKAKEISDKFDDKKVGASKIGLLLGPSGCGKTRTVLEYLSENFGIFLTASTVSNGGSNDMSMALKSDTNQHPSVSESINLVFKFESIVAIRIHFLTILGEMTAAKSLKLTPFHWLIIQQCPQELFGTDIFAGLLQYPMSLKIVDTEHMSSPFLIVIDEAQILISNKRFCGTSLLTDALEEENYSDANFDLQRSATTPILYSFSRMSRQQKHLRLWLAGTGFQYQEFTSECESSPILKELVKHFAFVTLGHFLKFEPFQAYIRTYIRPDKLSDHDVERAHRILRGRYRFTAAFVAMFCKDPDLDKVIEELKCLTVNSIQKSLTTLYNAYAGLHKGCFHKG